MTDLEPDVAQPASGNPERCGLFAPDLATPKPVEALINTHANKAPLGDRRRNRCKAQMMGASGEPDPVPLEAIRDLRRDGIKHEEPHNFRI
jgi:hypothetical protein